MRRSRMRGSIGGRATRGRSWVGAVMMPPRRSTRGRGVRSPRGAARARGARRSTRARGGARARISSYTSAACAPGSATKKLACFSDTTAPPTRSALAAGGVDEPAGGVAGRVREHRARVLPAGLVLAPPAHDLVDPAPRSPRARRRARRRSPPRPRRAAGSAEVPVAEAELRRGSASRTRPSARSNTRAPRITSAVCAP